MTFFDELGLRAAEQLETTVGAYVALASYKRLLDAAEPIGGMALLGALRCAVALGEKAEIEPMIERWAEAGNVPRPAIDQVLVLARTGKTALAAKLSEAEAKRRPTARAFYLRARIRDQLGESSLESWERAIELARIESDKRTLNAGVARWLEIVFAAQGRPSEISSSLAPLTLRGFRERITELALLADLETATESQRLLICRARLLSTSKFQRYAALSDLVALAKESKSGCSQHAIWIAVSHLDSIKERALPLEVDKVRAALKQWPDDRARESAWKRLDAALEMDGLGGATDDVLEALLSRLAAQFVEMSDVIQRARALSRGGTALGPRESHGDSPELRLTELGLDALGALQRNASVEAARALTYAKEALPPWSAIPAILYSVCLTALSRPDPPLRKAAGAFVVHSLARSFSAPSTGFLDLGAGLVRAGLFEEAEAVLVEAKRAGEPGAAGALAELERKLAYRALDRGDRDEARIRLTRAKELFEGNAIATDTLNRARPADPRG